MKKTIFLLILSICNLTVVAKQLSPQEALNRLDLGKQTRTMNFDLNKISPIMKISPQENEEFNSLYLFNCDNGYIIVSADDCAAPLLGYGDSPIDPSDLPPQLKYWLESYSSEIYSAVSFDVSTYSASQEPLGQAVTPIVKAKWNQGRPYNLMCPEFNGKRSSAGCVAVAMAQVMSAHKWPETCQGGNIAYTSRYSSSYITTLSLNFDEVSFDWDNILDSYIGDNATEINKDAVAELIMACGYSASTFYSPGESTAYADKATTAMYKYFNYSPWVQSVYRNYYTTREWEELIYNQLKQGLPVMYGGYSQTSGHRFVCDGYDGQGFFHINWGWGGVSDGYFRLTALDPSSQGIGGSASGYYYDQDATINIAKPEMEITGASPYMLYSTGNFLSSQIALHFAEDASETVKLGETVEFIRGLNTGVLNTSCRVVKGNFGISLVDEAGEIINVYSDNELTLNPNQKADRQSLTLPSDLKDGSYIVYPVFKFSDTGSYIILRCPVTSVSTLNMRVENGNAIITLGNYPVLESTGAVLKTDLKIDTYFSLDVEMYNAGNAPYYGVVGASLIKDDKVVAKTEETTIVELEAGEKNAFNLIGKFVAKSGKLTPGTYQLGFYDSDNNEIPVTNPVSVILEDKASFTKVTATEFSYSVDASDPSIITFNGTIKCEDGAFGGQATIWIFNMDDDDIYFSASTNFIFLNKDETADFSATTIVNIPGDYEAYIYVNDRYIYNHSLSFTISDESGVSVVKDDNFRIYALPLSNILTIDSEEPIKNIRVFSINGQEMINTNVEPSNKTEINIENLTKGVYVVSVLTVNNRIKTERIIKI